MKKTTIIIICGLIFISLFSFCLISFSLNKNKSRDEFYKKLDIFTEALVTIDDKYVSEKKPDELIEGALEGLLGSLDSYSQYLNINAYKDLLVETEGKFGGLGVEIMMLDGLLTIVSPLEQSPAAKAGLKSQDIIIKIDGELTKGISLNQAVEKLRGNPGEKVALTILRGQELKEITVIRDIIKIQDIQQALILENGIAYLRIAEFREKTPQDLDKALNSLANKAQGLIIDLRNNPGGLLDSALEAVSRFLENDKVIVTTRFRGKLEETYKVLPSPVKFLDIPIIVIINKGSASGSEIFAASLRQNNRAILLGETTFGKGSVQTVIPLSDGSALRLTTATYYTPWGNNIAERGVDPDIMVKDEYNEEKEDVFSNLEKKNSFQYQNDPCIIRALDLMKGLLVLKGKKN